MTMMTMMIFSTFFLAGCWVPMGGGVLGGGLVIERAAESSREQLELSQVTRKSNRAVREMERDGERWSC
jgi:hypothetical protein